jgi:hypothetical protein
MTQAAMLLDFAATERRRLPPHETDDVLDRFHGF